MDLVGIENKLAKLMVTVTVAATGKRNDIERERKNV